MSKQIGKVLLLTVLVLFATGTLAAQAPGKPYLALGDSIPLGLDPLVAFGDLLDYHGYPQFVSQAPPALALTNASCPGETSTSFLDVTAPDEGCHEWRAAGLPLFVTYTSTSQSQLAYAISFLKANPKTKLVTISIGGDDLLLLADTCAKESEDPAVIANCELSGLPKVLATFAKNLIEIYAAIRFEGRYEGPIVAANYFSPDYTNTLDTTSLTELNAITLGLTAAFGGRVADVFSAFQHASVAGGGLPCAPNVGLAYPNPPAVGGCNDHPTPLGQQLIAKLVLQALK